MDYQRQFFFNLAADLARKAAGAQKEIDEMGFGKPWTEGEDTHKQILLTNGEKMTKKKQDERLIEIKATMDAAMPEGGWVVRGEEFGCLKQIVDRRCKGGHRVQFEALGSLYPHNRGAIDGFIGSLKENMEYLLAAANKK